MGLVGKVVPQGQLVPTSIEMAERIAESHPKAIRMVKDLMYKSMNLSFDDWMDYLVLPQVAQDSDDEMISWKRNYDSGEFKKRSRYMQQGPGLD
jgi:enoyl-CoA hydratase/carnithine racemase